MKKVELLAPAKNMKAIKAALKNSDSVYFGIKGFNMREGADNFEIKDLANVVKYCHDRGKYAYLATNILIYDNELSDLRYILESAAATEVDGVIVHDFAAIEIAKELGLPFHISTQCNVSNSIAAKFYEKLGADRVILARECSLEKIKQIKNSLKRMKVEAFVHGAMCTMVSGRCYFSATVCGTPDKSANRGRCTQPCRRKWKVFDLENNEFIYDGVRFLNSRDLCMVQHIPKMIEAGIDCFKIEGRMRDPYYVDVVSRVYRQAIESYYNGTYNKKKVRYWLKELKKVFNRGFTTGFYFSRPTERDHQHKWALNLSHYRLIELGSIEKYDPESKMAQIKLTNGWIQKNMEIVITGKKTDTYFKQRIYKILMDGKKVFRTPKASENAPVLVQLKLKEPVKEDGQDKIYFFTASTYKNRYLMKKDKKILNKKDIYRL
ncbi:MAG: peptidase U32 family protein [Candidatus Helarchaeota archaeon]